MRNLKGGYHEKAFTQSHSDHRLLCSAPARLPERDPGQTQNPEELLQSVHQDSLRHDRRVHVLSADRRHARIPGAKPGHRKDRHAEALEEHEGYWGYQQRKNKQRRLILPLNICI